MTLAKEKNGKAVKVVNPKVKTPMFLGWYVEKCMDDEELVDIEMPKDIVGHAHSIYLSKEDILQFATMVEISASCFSVCIK
ncbi:hypothetical protein L484_018754 [Morus notabilis]|uniref:Uncharacterized protein n=1 Tax=Morus notabilis TaxID=981085 RepID=W9RRW6_9ROSA|nr:hypothetical protein L484_018754 [Morus notabilis]